MLVAGFDRNSDEWGWAHDPFFIGIRPNAPAIEEEGHMRRFLRFGTASAPRRPGPAFAHGPFWTKNRKDSGQAGELLVILNQWNNAQVGHGFHFEFVATGQRRLCELSSRSPRLQQKNRESPFLFCPQASRRRRESVEPSSSPSLPGCNTLSNLLQRSCCPHSTSLLHFVVCIKQRMLFRENQAILDERAGAVTRFKPH